MAGNLELESFPTLGFLVGLIGAVVLWKWLSRQECSSRLPESPSTLPLLGNMGMFMTGKQFVPVLDTICNQLGDVFTVWFRHKPVVFVGDHKVASDLFVNLSKVTSDRMTDSTVVSIASLQGKGVVFRCRDKQHHLNRKIGSAALRDLFNNKNAACARMLDVECKRIVEYLIAECADDGAVDPVHPLYKTTIRIISGTCFGKEFISRQGNVERVRDVVELAFKWMNMSTFFLVDALPWLRFVPFLQLNSVRLYAQARDALLDAEFSRHRDSAAQDGTPRDVTDIVLTSSEGNSDEDDKKMVITDLLLAGSETVSVTLSWVIWCLVTHPEWQVRLRREIEGVVESSDGGLAAIHPRSCPLVQAFYHEVQRWATPVPLSIMHEASSDFTFGDYTFHKGMQFQLYFKQMHHNAKHWHNPEQFDPMRFVNDAGEFAIPNRSFMPFSIGPRACPGDSLAKREMFFVLLYLVYHLTLLPEENGEMPPNGFHEQGTVRPLPFKIRVKVERAVNQKSS